MSRVLIVRLAALGDIALGSALLTRIRLDSPATEVDWLCGSRAAPLVRLFPGVSTVIEADDVALLRGNAVRRALEIVRLWYLLARRRYDRVLILHADARYRVLTLPLLRAHTSMLRLGPGEGSNPLPGRYRGAECARLLDGKQSNGPIERHNSLADIRGSVPSADRPLDGRRRVVLVPGGARNTMREDALRRWPVASYRMLAEQLIDAGCEIVLLGDANDVPFGQEFATLPVVNEIGKRTLMESMSLLRSADLVVSHDTGPLHLARLLRTPAVALFGPTNPAEFIGDDPGVTVLWGGAGLACRPCYDGRSFADCHDNLCLRTIRVSVVFDAVMQRIAAARPLVSAVRQ